METMYKSELDLLKRIAKADAGMTVNDLVAKAKIARQVAYGRLARLVDKKLVLKRTEASTGPRPQHRYVASKRGQAFAQKAWRKVSKRIVEEVV